MAKKVVVDHLVGAVEIAEALGVDRTQVHKWRTRPSRKGQPHFPEPIKTLTMGQVWDWAEVERWATATGRYPVKPERDGTD